MNTQCDHMKNAQSHAHKAAEAMGDHLLPREVRDHMRSAMKHVLLAGVAALNAAEQRSADRHASYNQGHGEHHGAHGEHHGAHGEHHGAHGEHHAAPVPPTMTPATA